MRSGGQRRGPPANLRHATGAAPNRPKRLPFKPPLTSEFLKQQPLLPHRSKQAQNMRTYAIILIVLLCGRVFGDNIHLSPRFRTVYILSMTDSLDQYLASRLTSGRVLWVVLEPASADAVLTDNLGENFWNWMARTYPATATASVNNRGTANGTAGPPPGKRHGTIFLVDPHRGVVLWSTYDLAKTSLPDELDRSAVRITGQLKTAFGKK